MKYDSALEDRTNKCDQKSAKRVCDGGWFAKTGTLTLLSGSWEKVSIPMPLQNRNPSTIESTLFFTSGSVLSLLVLDRPHW